jgi:hypothetical protein
MVTKAEAALAFTTLWTFHIAHIGKEFQGIRIRRNSTDSKVHMSTCVYKGENYIPQSVRKIAEKPLFDQPSSFFTYLVFEEDRFQISLHHTGNFSSDERHKFYEALREFEEIAYRWRDIFKEKDQEDLIHIPVNNA